MNFQIEVKGVNHKIGYVKDFLIADYPSDGQFKYRKAKLIKIIQFTDEVEYNIHFITWRFLEIWEELPE